MNTISTKGLVKRYGSLTAVDHLEFYIGQGEFFALLGVNGAGKTTVIKMLSCLSVPTEGDGTVCGYSIKTKSSEIKKLINLSPQETAVAPNLSVEENLRLCARLYGERHPEQRVKEMAEDFGLVDILNKRAGKLSGGYKRRLSIAMGLVTQPQVLFLDEPTLGLDVISRRELWRYIKKLKGQVTIVLTTHYLEEAVALADRIGIMAHGQLKAVGTAGELMEMAGTEQFEDAFIKLATEGEII